METRTDIPLETMLFEFVECWQVNPNSSVCDRATSLKQVLRRDG